MGDIRDQLCFHALVLEAVFYSCIQSLSNMVDIICHLFLFTGKFFCWNLVLEFSVSDLLQTSDDLLSSPGFFLQDNKELHSPLQSAEEKQMLNHH